MALPTPNGARGWLRTLLPLAQQGGPIVSLLLAVLAVAVVWYFLGVVERSRATSLDLLQRLLTCQEQKLEILKEATRSP